MKPKHIHLTSLFISIIFLINCEKRPWEDSFNNPFHPHCQIDWSPNNFQAIQNGNSIKLTWDQEVIKISGFRIQRSINNGPYTDVHTAPKNSSSWIDSNVSGGNLYQYQLYAYADQYESTIKSAQITPAPTTGTFTDSRDGNTYKWVKIGDQIWMAENLAYLPKVSPPSVGSENEPYYYVYGYNGNSVSAAKATGNYKTYGVLYNWPAAKAACPDGWHLPTDAEWEQLAKYVSDQKGPYGKSGDDWKNVGKHLKATSGWYNNGNGSDDFGFSGLSGGNRYYGGNFDFIGLYGDWWSATELSSNDAWTRTLLYVDEYFYRGYDSGKELGFSLRCVRD